MSSFNTLRSIDARRDRSRRPKLVFLPMWSTIGVRWKRRFSLYDFVRFRVTFKYHHFWKFSYSCVKGKSSKIRFRSGESETTSGDAESYLCPARHRVQTQLRSAGVPPQIVPECVKMSGLEAKVCTFEKYIKR